MDRRQYLATLGAGLAAGVAGCSDTASPTTTRPSTTTTTPTTRTTTETTTRTTTETTRTTTQEPASFRLESVSAPNTVEIREQTSYSFTVTNTGEQTGEFSTTIRWRAGSGEWSEGEPWRATLQPGETRTLESQSFTNEYLASFDFEITAFDYTFSIQFVSATAAFGQGQRVTDNVMFLPTDLTFQDSYQWTSGEYTYTEDAPSGTKYAFVTVSATNLGNTPVRVPSKYSIDLISGNTQYSYNPIAKRGAYQGGRIQPDITRNGWICYLVDNQTTKESIELVYSRVTIDGDVVVTWTHD